MHAFLVVGGTQGQREKRAQKFTQEIHPMDTIVLSPDPSIGIENVRKLNQKLFLKPSYSPLKATLIYQADKMTIAAQNAFLKTLEEPPGACLIVLTAPNTELLAPTLVSRCQIITLPPKAQIRLTNEDLVSSLKAAEEILKGQIGKQLALSEKISQDRHEAIVWLKMQTVLWRYLLLIKQDCRDLLPNGVSRSKLKQMAQKLTLKQIKETIKKIQKSKIMLQANVHTRLVIDNLLLNYPSL
jgi:DNA polymerase III gamma/tau subunit